MALKAANQALRTCIPSGSITIGVGCVVLTLLHYVKTLRAYSSSTWGFISDGLEAHGTWSITVIGKWELMLNFKINNIEAWQASIPEVHGYLSFILISRFVLSSFLSRPRSYIYMAQYSIPTPAPYIEASISYTSSFTLWAIWYVHILPLQYIFQNWAPVLACTCQPQFHHYDASSTKVPILMCIE